MKISPKIIVATFLTHTVESNIITIVDLYTHCVLHFICFVFKFNFMIFFPYFSDLTSASVCN